MDLNQISVDDQEEAEEEEEASQPDEEEEHDEESEVEAIMTQMTGSMTRLSLEIIFDILSRVPIKTLSESCRWVSKSWFKIVRHPSFAQTQHTKALKSFSPCVTYWTRSSKSFWLVDHQVFDTHANSTMAYDLNIKGFGHVFDVLRACNGLICMQPDPFCYKPEPYFVFNPVTRQSINLPKSPMYKRAPITSGFGFSPVTNEYKVVRILETREVEIYTLGSPVWRRIPDIPHVVGGEPVFLNGALHWCAFDRSYSYIIIALDMATEEFRIIPPPPPPCVTRRKRMITDRPVGVLGGCRCFTDDIFVDRGSLSDHIEAWVMKSYGVQRSWSKEYVFTNGGFPYLPWNDGYEVIKLENGELLLKDIANNLCSFEQHLLHYYDPNRNAFQHILTHGIPSSIPFLRPLIHVGSLISPQNVGRSRKSMWVGILALFRLTAYPVQKCSSKLGDRTFLHRRNTDHDCMFVHLGMFD